MCDASVTVTVVKGAVPLAAVAEAPVTDAPDAGLVATGVVLQPESA